MRKGTRTDAERTSEEAVVGTRVIVLLTRNNNRVENGGNGDWLMIVHRARKLIKSFAGQTLIIMSRDEMHEHKHSVKGCGIQSTHVSDMGRS